MKESPERRMVVKQSIVTAVFILSVVVFLFVISGKRASPLPDDALHVGVLGAASCLTCHSHGGQAPLKASHPLKEQCLTCHRSWKDCHPSRGGKS